MLRAPEMGRFYATWINFFWENHQVFLETRKQEKHGHINFLPVKSQ